MEIAITIQRQNVLGIVEGISATIAQHNGGEPSFDQLWASDSDSPKLDIWWRDGVTDLEAALMKWAAQTTNQFVLQSESGDLSLLLNLDDRWSSRLTGLLKNKVQQFMIHAVIAGWLADFHDVVAPDYKAMAAADIMSILNILLYRDLAFTESTRTTDVAKDNGDGNAITPSARTTDVAKDSGDGNAITPSQRTTDVAKDNGDGNAITPSQRTTDVAKDNGDGNAITPSARTTDVAKDNGDGNAITPSQRTTDVAKDNGDGNAITPSQRTTDVAKDNGDGNAITPSQRTTDVAKDNGDVFVHATEDRDRDDMLKPPRYYDPDVVYFV